MDMKTDGTDRMPVGKGKIFLALGILAVLAMVAAAFAVADHPATDRDVVATGGGRTHLSIIQTWLMDR